MIKPFQTLIFHNGHLKEQEECCESAASMSVTVNIMARKLQILQTWFQISWQGGKCKRKPPSFVRTRPGIISRFSDLHFWSWDSTIFRVPSNLSYPVILWLSKQQEGALPMDCYSTGAENSNKNQPEIPNTSKMHFPKELFSPPHPPSLRLLDQRKKIPLFGPNWAGFSINIPSHSLTECLLHQSKACPALFSSLPPNTWNISKEASPKKFAPGRQCHGKFQQK